MLASEFGVDAAHVVDVGLCEASDALIWEYAANTNCVLIAKDLDFARIALQRTECALVWVRLGNLARQQLLLKIRNVWPRIVDRLQSGERLIELR